MQPPTHERAKQPEKVWELLQDMQWKSWESELISYDAAISACKKGKQQDEA